ncbi:DNA-binding transcriptional regulator, XRE-family HTH domain [Salegentibacter echinorum]|uniref:DNA-binding transcriptional regulator, XRE-family HTH domain n=1 Tax=Salegentibacter echinorum TaxID=1073325 RepID=A0A1M5J253_SALEC|nr:helix-turn-helix transcriptional regulator [Salegentibacter echinorum]SHG34654.1 DNA-binding transcriptional regulator, XRE-family HTH domain [Salegentibacter echinorum]
MNLLRLKELLKERKITGKQFAEDLGFSKNTASNLINGKSFPSGKDLKAIADYLDVDIKELFNSTKEAPERAIYVEMDGKYSKIGELKLDRLDEGSVTGSDDN